MNARPGGYVPSTMAPTTSDASALGSWSRRRFLAGSALSIGGLAALGCARPSKQIAPAGLPNELAWEPARTFAFFVGLVEFENPSVYESFDVRERKDRELFERLIGRGVPASQAVFLDLREATRASIEKRLAAMLARTRPGDLLWVHYSGHGTRLDDGRAFFATYDATEDVSTCWSVASIVDAIERGHRGERALLSADCCHSGALAREAVARRGRVAYGCVTSSLAHESSTGAWTFTECLLDAVSGSIDLDLDRDGRVQLEELGRYAERELAFVEGQLTQFATTPNFPQGFVLAKSASTGVARERVEVHLDGAWSRAHVLAREPGRVRVRLVGEERTERWVALARVRPFRPVTFAPGAEVEVESGDDSEPWRAAEVLDQRLGVHLVHYADDPEGVRDEWLAGWSLRERQHGADGADGADDLRDRDAEREG